MHDLDRPGTHGRQVKPEILLRLAPLHHDRTILGQFAADFVSTDIEYYLGDDGIAYVRPGLAVKVNSVTIVITMLMR